LDVDLMMALSNRVNVIPVIAKADTLTEEELIRNKRAIMEDIELFNIPIYYFPCDPEDKEAIEECNVLRELVPFTVVGSNNLYNIDDECIRARKYPWGIVRIEDPDHSDFVALRSVLFGSHLQELRDLTHEVLYEKYRTEKLEAENGGGELSPGPPHIHVHHHDPPLPPTIVHSELLYKEQQRLREIEEAAQKDIGRRDWN
jgi:cell division control protein 11